MSLTHESLVKTTVQLKKVTYKLNEDVIERLDPSYLQMRLERGKLGTLVQRVPN